jgi:hypothetical protein
MNIAWWHRFSAPTGQADEHQVEHPYHHEQAILPGTRRLPLANQQVRHLYIVSEPHKVTESFLLMTETG